MTNKSGFTLVELMVTVFIIVVALVGMLQLFIFTSVQSELGGNITKAMGYAQNIVEEIREYDFALITANYASGATPGDKFFPSDMNAAGNIQINSANTELLVIRVVVSWEDKYGRIIGEDLDLDGVLDLGEDVNGNGSLDSPVLLMSMITRR